MADKVRPLRIVDSNPLTSSKEIVSGMASSGTAALKARLKQKAQENYSKLAEEYRVPDTLRVKTWTCPKCKFDTDGVENHGYTRNPYSRQAEPCTVCSPPVIANKARRILDRKIKELVPFTFPNMENIPDDGDLFSLDAYPKHADQTARKIVEMFLENKIKEVFLWGEPGRGKTGLAISAAKALSIQGEQVLFIPDVMYLDMLRADSDFNNHEKSHIREIVHGVNNLFIDDMGMEAATRKSVEETGALINARHASGKRTFITSNMSLDGLAACWFLPEYERTGFQPAARIISRMRGYYRKYQIAGPDLRQG